MEHYSEHESMLLSESHQNKRNSDVAENTNVEEKKSKKKRRSSLASTRRSITGNVPSKDELGADLPSSYSSSASSQPLNDNDDQKAVLKPNPLNTRMGEIIQEFENNISRLDQEYAQWKMALKDLEHEQEQTKLLSEGNVSISPDDIPQELKDFAKSEFMHNQIDFGVLSTKVEKGLLKSYFDIQKCLQDMKLFRGTVNTIKCHNKYAKDPHTLMDDEGDLDDTDMDTTSGVAGHGLLTDVKSQLEWMMNN